MTTNQLAKKSPFAFFVVVMIAAAVAIMNASQEQPAEPSQEHAIPASNAEPTSTPVSVDVPSPQQNESKSEAKSFLTETRRDVFESPAGLTYKSGSADGHRLDHLKDDHSKPVHGVFNGSREDVLALLDEVWQISKTRGPPDVHIEQQRGRTVISVNLNRNVGYVGGESGKRKQNPPCTKVRLVVEDRDVITAYPTN